MFEQLAENLNLLMAKHDVSALRLARESGVPISTVKKLRNKTLGNPTLATLLPIVQFFDISIDQLLCDNQKSSKKVIKKQQCYEYPLISMHEATDLFNYRPNGNMLLALNQYSESAFAIKVDCYDWPPFSPNTTLIIDPIEPLSHNDYVLVHFNGQNQVNFKKFRIEESNSFLQSLSVSTNIVPFSSEYRLLGVVMEGHNQIKQSKSQWAQF